MAQEEKRSVTGKLHVNGEVEIRVPREVQNENAIAKEKADRRDGLKLRVEVLTLLFGVLTFLVVGIYAILTYWQARSTQTLVDLTRKQFTADQRPYVLAVKVVKNQDAAGRTFFDLATADYGRSPALHMKGRGGVYEGPDAISQGDHFFATVDADSFVPPPPQKLYSEGVLQPGPVDKDTGDWRATYYAPGSGDVLTFDEGHDFHIVIVSRIDYEDLSGNKYHTDFCYAVLASQAIAQCPAHNDVH
jgi:hypothetical protein